MCKAREVVLCMHIAANEQHDRVWQSILHKFMQQVFFAPNFSAPNGCSVVHLPAGSCLNSAVCTDHTQSCDDGHAGVVQAHYVSKGRRLVSPHMEADT